MIAQLSSRYNVANTDSTERIWFLLDLDLKPANCLQSQNTFIDNQNICIDQIDFKNYRTNRNDTLSALQFSFTLPYPNDSYNAAVQQLFIDNHAENVLQACAFVHTPQPKALTTYLTLLPDDKGKINRRLAPQTSLAQNSTSAYNATDLMIFAYELWHYEYNAPYFSANNMALSDVLYPKRKIQILVKQHNTYYTYDNDVLLQVYANGVETANSNNLAIECPENACFRNVLPRKVYPEKVLTKDRQQAYKKTKQPNSTLDSLYCV